ncbi:antitoxin Xre/MbcA/ParS-like domain-containing protein [Brucella daejeonensis]|uniref:antitoxin Xre/MbcA/ParS-like domain-containing protein n=1 Tax=Brucella daejeonensis TaxID=659015 RepID=UPI00161B5DD3
MTVVTRKSQVRARSEVNPAAVADVLKVLARYNPGLSKPALVATGKVMAVVSAAAARLSVEQQRRIAANETELVHIVEAVVSELATKSSHTLAKVPVEKFVEVSQGMGPGQLVDKDEGRRRLAEFAKPTRIEDWAGAVAGPGDIEKKFGTKRSTLHDWHKRGAVIGLLKGERKHVFPLAQFVDGRPVEGMAQIMRIIHNPRVAWRWLTDLKPSIGGTPLEHLKKGNLEVVLDAAERDFG